MKLIIAVLLFSTSMLCAQTCGRLVVNPITGQFDCTGSGSSSTGNNTYCADATGSTTTYTCPTPTPTVTSLTGLQVLFVPQTTNTGTSTLNVAGLGAKTLKASDGSTNIASGALVGGTGYLFGYDGTNFRLASSQYTGGCTPLISNSSTVATVTIPNCNGTGGMNLSSGSVTTFVTAGTYTVTIGSPTSGQSCYASTTLLVYWDPATQAFDLDTTAASLSGITLSGLTGVTTGSTGAYANAVIPVGRLYCGVVSGTFNSSTPFSLDYSGGRIDVVVPGTNMTASYDSQGRETLNAGAGGATTVVQSIYLSMAPGVGGSSKALYYGGWTVIASQDWACYDTTTMVGAAVQCGSGTNTDAVAYEFTFPSNVTSISTHMLGDPQSSTGTVIFTWAIGCEAIGSVALGGSLNTGTASATATNPATNWYEFGASNLTLTGCGANSQAYLKITRSGTNTGFVLFQSARVDITRTLP